MGLRILDLNRSAVILIPRMITLKGLRILDLNHSVVVLIVIQLTAVRTAVIGFKPLRGYTNSLNDYVKGSMDFGFKPLRGCTYCYTTYCS
jgi:hypothetical protein